MFFSHFDRKETIPCKLDNKKYSLSLKLSSWKHGETFINFARHCKSLLIFYSDYAVVLVH